MHHREVGEHSRFAHRDTKLLHQAAFATPRNPPLYDWRAEPEAGLDPSTISSAFHEPAQTVVFTMISTEMIEMANNWLCSLAPFASKSVLGVLLLGTESSTCAQLSVPPTIAAASFKCIYPYFSASHGIDRVASDVVYQSGRYTRLMKDKLRLMRLVARTVWAARAQSLVYSDVDVVFIRSPTELSRGLHVTSQRLPTMLFSRNTCEGPLKICAGFLVFSASNFTLDIMDHAWALLESGVTYDAGDQGAFRVALGERKSFENGVADHISCSLVAPGCMLGKLLERHAGEQEVGRLSSQLDLLSL